MVSRPSGNSTEESFVLSNAYELMVCNPFEKLTSARFVHPSNALLPMVLKVLLNTTVVKFVQL